MEPRKVAAAGVLLAWIGLLLPWERWDSLASSGDTGRGPAVFAVILALTTALVVFRFVKPVVCIFGVTLAAIALHAAIGSLTAGGLFVETDPGAGTWVAALGAAVYRRGRGLANGARDRAGPDRGRGAVAARRRVRHPREHDVLRRVHAVSGYFASTTLSEG